jgi:hypothetical protein
MVPWTTMLTVWFRACFLGGFAVGRLIAGQRPAPTMGLTHRVNGNDPDRDHDPPQRSL